MGMFNHNPKCCQELVEVVDVVLTRRGMILRNVHTWWISMLQLAKRVEILF